MIVRISESIGTIISGPTALCSSECASKAFAGDDLIESETTSGQPSLIRCVEA